MIKGNVELYLWFTYIAIKTYGRGGGGAPNSLNIVINIKSNGLLHVPDPLPRKNIPQYPKKWKWEESKEVTKRKIPTSNGNLISIYALDKQFIN
jgi:hypothetical protein